MTPFVLKRPHTHAGMAYQAGDRIDVEATTADWLIAHGVAAPDAVPPKADPESADLKPDLPRSQRKEPKP
ncbi:MAG: hypothetical protein KDH20_16340 [Rhodocyclaceae bacterium]|nr:hypothetical protein [Rhodocyclaceae bacterium]